MDQQRWVKASVSELTGGLQGGRSLAEFGDRLLSGLVPMVGGGVASFYLFDETQGRLRRVSAYGLVETAGSPGSFKVGEGLVGECARGLGVVTLTNLPANYLQIASGVGHAPPVQTTAFPVRSKDALLGVLEVASLRPFSEREQALFAEVLPVVAMSLEILQRNLHTQELLRQTQAQADQLAEQAEELAAAKEKAEFEGVAQRIASLRFIAPRKVGEHDVLYGSVTSGDVAEFLKNKGVEIDKRKVLLDEPVKKLGEHDVRIKLHPEVTATLKLLVSKEG